MGKIDVPTVFFGGGTPSLMPVYVFDKIITTIKNSFNLHADAEITLESNPKTLDFNLSPYTGMTRQSWIEAGEYMLEGIFNNIIITYYSI